jgi:hypothetical protein
MRRVGFDNFGRGYTARGREAEQESVIFSRASSVPNKADDCKVNSYVLSGVDNDISLKEQQGKNPLRKSADIRGNEKDPNTEKERM